MIPLVDLVAQYQSIKPELDDAIQKVLRSGRFILGPQEAAFEREVVEFLGVRHAIGVASGTDALVIALRACGIGAGDEVIIPAYTFFATAGAVLNVGAKPVFVDIDPNTYLMNYANISNAINERTKAIIPVHLYGQPADMDEICCLASEYGLKVIEDNAQAFGAFYKGKRTGSIGDIGCLSFFPTKNLGAYGDGGMVTTNSDDLASQIRKLRTHGWEKKYYPELLGYNSRLDELQAAILRVKLDYLDQWNVSRQRIAALYIEQLSKSHVITPKTAGDRTHVFHLFIIRVSEREKVRSFLRESGVSTDVYYPLPVHLTEPIKACGYGAGSFPVAELSSRETLAIPLFPELTPSQIDTVITTVNYAVESVCR